MAELTPSSKSTGSKHDKRSAVRGHAPKVDMTAMVDVAFLLLTFFVLSAQLLDQRAIELIVPADRVTTTEVDESKVMTLLLLPGDSVVVMKYAGEPSFEQIEFNPTSIRAALLNHKNMHSNLCEGTPTRGCWDPILVVKAHPRARYAHLIDVLDEIAITGMPKYALAPFTEADSLALIQKGISFPQP